MPRATLKKILGQSQCQTKGLCWGIFLLGIVSYWIFQHQFVLDIYAYLGVSVITLICLLLVVCMLTYSISHKLKLPTEWYALAFVPGTMLLALIANEHLSGSVIIMCAFTVIAWLVLSVKKPKLRCNPLSSNLWILIVTGIMAILCSNTNELTHNKHQIMHYIAQGNYGKALSVGANSQSTDSAIFNLRATAMLYSGQLGSKLFSYPIPREGYPHIRIAQMANDTDTKDIVLCNLLLQKRTADFARLLPRFYDINSATLPQSYKEALVVYTSRSTNPVLSYSNTIVEANYADFLAEKKRHSSPQESARKCHELYGNTYFWYYFFSDNPSTGKDQR